MQYYLCKNARYPINLHVFSCGSSGWLLFICSSRSCAYCGVLLNIKVFLINRDNCLDCLPRVIRYLTICRIRYSFSLVHTTFTLALCLPLLFYPRHVRLWCLSPAPFSTMPMVCPWWRQLPRWHHRDLLGQSTFQTKKLNKNLTWHQHFYSLQ